MNTVYEQERVKALAILREHLREADAKQSGLANLVKAVKSKQPYVASPPRPRPRPSPPPLPVPLPLPPPLPSAWPSETQNVGVQVAAIGSAPELSKAAKRAAKRRTQFGSIMMQLQTWFGLAWTVAEMMRLVALPVSSPEDPGGSMGHMVKGAIQGTNGDVEVEARIARQRREFVDALLGASSLAMSVAHIVGILKASSEQVVNSLLKNVPNEYQAHLLDVFACEVSMAATMLGVVMQRHVIAAKLGEELRAVVAEARTLYVPSHLEWNRSQQEVSNRLLGAGGAIKAVLNLCVKVAAEADPKTVKASRKSKRTAVMRGEAAGRSSSALKTEHVSQRLQSLTKPIANALQLAAAVSRTPLASLGDFSGKPDSVENLTPESEWRRSHGGPMALAYAEQAKCVAAVVEHRVGALAASINDVVRAIKEEWNPHDVRSAMLRARRKACTAFELLQAVRRGVAVGDRDTIAAAEAEGAALPAPPSCVWGLELLVERVHVVSRYAELTLRIYVTAGGARSSIMNACTSFSPSPSRELTLMKEARRLIAATLTLAVAIVEHVSAWANFTSGAVAIRNARMGAVAALVTHLLQDLDSSMALLEVIPVEQKPYHQAICDRIRCEARTVCVMLASVNEGIATDSKEALAAAVREGWLVTAESDHQTSRLHSTIKNTVQATEEVLKRVAVDATGGSPSSVATREVLHLTGNFLAQQKLLSVKATVVQCFLKQVNAQVAALQSSVQMQSAHQVIKKHYDAARGILGSAQVALGCFTGSNPRVNPTMEIRILLAGHAMTLKSEQEAHWDPQQLARELRDTCVAAENSFQKFKNSRSKKVKNNKELSFAIAATVATRELVNALGRLY